MVTVGRLTAITPQTQPHCGPPNVKSAPTPLHDTPQ